MAEEEKMDANTKRKVYSTAAGVTDPVLRKWAQKLAAATPPGSIFRHEYFESMVGAIKGLVESFTRSMPPGAAVLVEKATDFSDFFTGALGKGEKAKAKTVEDWMSSFFKEVGERLKKAKDPTAEFERIKIEFDLRRKILRVIEEASKEARPAEPSVEPLNWDWDAAWKKVKKLKRKLKAKAKKAASAINKTGKKATPHVRNFRLWLERKGVQQ